MNTKAIQLLHQQFRCQYVQPPIQLVYVLYFIDSIQIVLSVATQPQKQNVQLDVLTGCSTNNI